MSRSKLFCIFFLFSFIFSAAKLSAQVALLGNQSNEVVTNTQTNNPLVGAVAANGPRTAGDYVKMFPSVLAANKHLATEAGRREFLQRFNMEDWTKGTNIQLMSMNPETQTFRADGPPTHLFFGAGLPANDPRRQQLREFAGMLPENSKPGQIMHNLTNSNLGQAIRNEPLGVSFLTRLPQNLDEARNPSSMFGSVLGLGVIPNAPPVMNQHQIQIGENLTNKFLAGNDQLRQSFSENGATVNLNGASVDFRDPRNGADASMTINPDTSLSMCQHLYGRRHIWANGLNTSLSADINKNDRGTYDLSGHASGTAHLQSNQVLPIVHRISANVGHKMFNGKTCQMAQMAESTVNGAVNQFSDTPCPTDVWPAGTSMSHNRVYGPKGLRGRRYGVTGAQYHASGTFGFNMQGINPNSAVRHVLQMPPTEQPALPITGITTQRDRLNVTATVNPNNRMVGAVNNTTNRVIDGVQAIQGMTQ